MAALSRFIILQGIADCYHILCNTTLVPLRTMSWTQKCHITADPLKNIISLSRDDSLAPLISKGSYHRSKRSTKHISQSLVLGFNMEGIIVKPLSPSSKFNLWWSLGAVWMEQRGLGCSRCIQTVSHPVRKQEKDMFLYTTHHHNQPTTNMHHLFATCAYIGYMV